MTIKSTKNEHYPRRNRKRIRRNIDSAHAVMTYGADVLNSDGHKSCAKFIQHGDTSVQRHTISVACLSVTLARKTHLRYDYSSLVRGALLHDYFLYDWHDPHNGHRFHGFTHASTALHNAAENFAISPIEADIIKKHMWPLNINPMRYRESAIVTIADKICSIKEVFGKPIYNQKVEEILNEYC